MKAELYECICYTEVLGNGDMVQYGRVVSDTALLYNLGLQARLANLVNLEYKTGDAPTLFRLRFKSPVQDDHAKVVLLISSSLLGLGIKQLRRTSRSPKVSSTSWGSRNGN